MVLSKQERPAPPPDTDTEFAIKVQMRDGHESNIRIYKPDSVTKGSTPLLVVIHGGAFVLGSNTDVAQFARAAASLYNVTVASLSYRLAPEFKFPTAPNDIWDSLEWLSSPANASSLGADLSLGFVLSGISAGANLAAVTAQRWVSEAKNPALTGMWLSIPYVLEPHAVPPEYKDLWFSRDQNASALIINSDAIAFVKATYEPDVHSPALSPFNAENPHKGLPPVYIQVAGQDPLRDDGLIYDKALRAAGVETKLDVYSGAPHGHFAMFPSLKSSQKSNLDTIKGLGWLLQHKQISDEDIIAALAAQA